ncbi:glycosyltransferase [Ravibacter arvi]|uniref:Glycosyltransferase n=1 Tax=Ravibacter arvi TaxID=2051041 RepID=A0ABP8MAG3_9BACT
MKILNICAYTWEIGGPARIIYDHTVEALEEGHEVHILSPCSPGDKLYPAPEGARLIPCKRSLPISRFYREYSVELLRYLQHHINDYDVVHIHGIWHFGSLAPFLVKSNVPKIITIHGLLDQWAVNHHAWKKNLVSFLYQKKLLAKAAAIQVNNTDEESDVTQYLGYRPDNLVIIPNGMRMKDYRHLPEKGTFRKQFDIPADSPLLLFMGRLNVKKGLDLLLPAFRAFHSKAPRALLVLAGPDDGYEAEAQRFVETHQLREAVKFVGMLTGDIKKAALSDATAFVLPTYSEGFSIAVLEAMASRLPAIVSDRTGFGDYTRQFDAAALTALNSDDLAKKIELTLTDAQYRQTKAQNAYKMVAELFDIKVVARQLLEVYRKAIVASKLQ